MRGRTFVRNSSWEAVSVHNVKHFWYFTHCFARPLNFSVCTKKELSGVPQTVLFSSTFSSHTSRTGKDPERNQSMGYFFPWYESRSLGCHDRTNYIAYKGLYLYINYYCWFRCCCGVFFLETFSPMVTVVVLPCSPWQETPFLARLKHLVSSFTEGNRHTPFKRGNQNHHKYLPICLPRGSDLGYKMCLSVGQSGITSVAKHLALVRFQNTFHKGNNILMWICRTARTMTAVNSCQSTNRPI